MATRRRAPRAVSNILRDGPRSLQSLVRRADAYRDLHDAVRALLPDALVAEVRAVHAEDDTLVVVASDHGEAFGEWGFEGHARKVYRETTEVPFIVSLPFRLEPGVVVEQRIGRCAAALAPEDPLRRTLERLARRVSPRRDG